MQAALQRPDLFYAYVGIGHVICTRENEAISFNYGLAQATKLHNEEALKELRSIAPYPDQQPITRDRIIIARKRPLKKAMWFENSAHLIPLEEPGKMLLSLVGDVRPLAERADRGPNGQHSH